MFFLITIFLTALVSALFGLLPGKLQRRSVIKQDIVWAVGYGWPPGCSRSLPTTAPG